MPSGWEAERCADALDQAKADLRRSLAVGDELASKVADLKATCERFERGIRAIAASTLTGADFGDWVQATCEDLLAGEEAECAICGTPVHEGACASDGADQDPRPLTEALL